MCQTPSAPCEIRTHGLWVERHLSIPLCHSGSYWACSFAHSEWKVTGTGKLIQTWKSVITCCILHVLYLKVDNDARWKFAKMLPLVYLKSQQRSKLGFSVWPSKLQREEPGFEPPTHGSLDNVLCLLSYQQPHALHVCLQLIQIGSSFELEDGFEHTALKVWSAFSRFSSETMDYSLMSFQDFWIFGKRYKTMKNDMLYDHGL